MGFIYETVYACMVHTATLRTLVIMLFSVAKSAYPLATYLIFCYYVLLIVAFL